MDYVVSCNLSHGCAGDRRSFQYDSGKLKAYSTYSYTHYGQNPPTSYTFGYSGGILTSANSTWPSIYIANYTYDSSGRLIDKQVGSIHYTYEYYPDGNLYKYTDSNDPTNNKIYNSYDTKNNPLRLGGFTPEYLTLYAVPMNNPTSMNNETYTYQYNSFGYPTQKITTDGSSTSTTVYTYE
jgi:YD repeat-containing protein